MPASLKGNFPTHPCQEAPVNITRRELRSIIREELQAALEQFVPVSPAAAESSCTDAGFSLWVETGTEPADKDTASSQCPTVTEAYQDYCEFLDTSPCLEGVTPLSRSAFRALLEARGVEIVNSGGVRCRLNLYDR